MRPRGRAGGALQSRRELRGGAGAGAHRLAQVDGDRHVLQHLLRHGVGARELQQQVPREHVLDRRDAVLGLLLRQRRRRGALEHRAQRREARHAAHQAARVAVRERLLPRRMPRRWPQEEGFCQPLLCAGRAPAPATLRTGCATACFRLVGTYVSAGAPQRRQPSTLTFWRLPMVSGAQRCAA